MMQQGIHYLATSRQLCEDADVLFLGAVAGAQYDVIPDPQPAP